MRIIAALLASLTFAALPATPAHADIAGRYETVDDNALMNMEMTVEADENGAVRIQMANLGSYYLMSEGDLYLVTKDADDFVVVRMEDQLTVQREAMDRMGVKLPDSEDFISDLKSKFAPMEPQTVGGRAGMAYGILNEKLGKPVYASIVISNDSALAPLGKAIVDANSASLKGMGQLGTMLGMMGESMMALLEQGAPLRMLSVELTDLSFDPIPPDRFTLPAEPLSLEELRESLSVTIEPPPTLPPRED
ncbi:hypothetical protein [Alteriqipengyuania sp.]|uniref:hypothetical protein n=1 Tax=Alteriqipengyuania sp. TaxID=2800692 RepID=UPI003513CE68